jgi:ATP/maltotriose-dependent transcriptional regulator MalT
LVERLVASASSPITLLIAPAGYGKSVVLRQYLHGLRDPHVRFALRSEHVTLLSFLRGLAEAMRASAPHAITALAGAYERTTASPKRGAELARWMHAHLESFRGVIAIDDLHVADDDPEVLQFLTALIERTKGRIRWILASRSTTGLPLGTWLGYRDADLPIDEEELRFTLDEVQAAARGLGLAIRNEELSDLLALTEGWPAAMSFALRTSTRSTELRNVSAITREMIYRFLAEQVYSALDNDERALLEVAITLPVIDVGVLESAGFDRALPIVERLRERTAFIYEESPGVYQCHDLFREFLRHQSALGGKRAQQLAHERAARALESSGDIEHAISAYVSAGSAGDVVRLLEQHGFDMLERARGDVVARGIESLDEATRRENATVLALQGTLQAIAGKFARAEALFRRSLARAGTNRNLVAITSLRLASVMGNQGKDVTPVLDPVAIDGAQSPAHRAEALSLLAARQALAGDIETARRRIERIEELLSAIESDATRAKVLHHVGIVSRHVGDGQRAFEALQQSSELATDLHLYGVLSRANAVLSNLALHERDDVDSQLRYAEGAAQAASKAGDAFALQTALLQMLSAQMRHGNIEKSTAIEQRLAMVKTDDLAIQYLTLFRAIRLAWEGRFSDGHRLMASSWASMHFDFDRVACGSQYALLLALDGCRETSVSVIQQVLGLARSMRASGLFGVRSVAISQVFCALAEIGNGRPTRADRILRQLPASDIVEKSIVHIGKAILRESCASTRDDQAVIRGIEAFATLGYGDVARLLRVAYPELRVQRRSTERDVGLTSSERDIGLTSSERDILRFLADGLVPKEIAADSNRSVHTVEAHIARAIAKLQCHGRAEAVRTAQRLGLI